jgi:anaerobic ribonucleoside-triphosphate reductase
MSVEKVIPCEVFSRVVGYYRPITNYNEGKLEEFKDRTFFKDITFFKVQN